MTVAREVELEGHIIDSGMMGAAFGIVMDLGGSFDVDEFDIGRSKTETSYARLTVYADDEATLEAIVHELHQNGANPADPEDAALTPAPADRVVPNGFYSTTNHPTDVRVDGEWVPVEDIEMDCAVVVTDRDGDPGARTKVLNAVEAGALVVTGEAGIRVRPPERAPAAGRVRSASCRAGSPRSGPRSRPSSRSPTPSSRPSARAARCSRFPDRR